MISVQDIIKVFDDGSFEFPDMYPDPEFVKRHYKIIRQYAPFIKFYKGTGYRDVNTYYKTGEIPRLNSHLKEDLYGQADVTNEKVWDYVLQKIDEMYEKIEPLEYDIIIYRGVKYGTIGQNFNGDCIRTKRFDGIHRYCPPERIRDIEYVDFDKDPYDYAYETQGFVSTTTAIYTAINFGCNVKCDVLMTMRLPAGSKFILPVKRYHGAYLDAEKEILLFPGHNAFVLAEEKVNYPVKYNFGALQMTLGENVQIGGYCTDLEKSRRTPFVEHINLYKQPVAGDCSKEKIQKCNDDKKICNPLTGKCLKSTPQNIYKIQNFHQ